MPRVLRHAGIVLSNVQLVTVTFEDYGARELVEQFGGAIVGSSWYAAVGTEYGVKPGAHLPPVRLGPAPASLTRDGIASLIKQLISDGLLPAPSMVGNQLLYMLYVPASVSRGPDLAEIAGYHQMVTLNGVRFPIAVVLDTVAGDEGISMPSTAAARQLINAVTNPYDPPYDGYYADPPMIDPWSLARGEVADMCEGEMPITEDDLVLPRVYSDEAAADDRPPCMPMMPGDVWNDVSASPSTMQHIAAGDTATVELTGWSTEEVPDWTLSTQAADFSDFTEAQMQPELSEDTINNGRTVTLTLHAPRAAPRGATGGLYILSRSCWASILARREIVTLEDETRATSCADRRWVVGFVVQ